MMNCHKDKDCNKGSYQKKVRYKSILKMSACCLGPILIFFVLSALGIRASGILVLLCPLMMVYMIWMMAKEQQKEEKNSKTEFLTDSSHIEVDSVPQAKELD